MKRANEGSSRLLLTTAVGTGIFLGLRSAIRATRRIDLRDKVVLITGGSRGLGLALARAYGEQGAKLALCARDERELADARDDLARRGTAVISIPCDVTDQAQVESMVREVVERWGRIDVLVNNAGTIQVGPMETMTVADYDQAMKLHFWAPLYTTLAVLPQMRRRGTGRIVNIASIGGKVAAPHLLPYSASKFALVGFSEGFRSELMKDGIYVTTVCTGLMRTGSPRNALFKGQHRKEYAWFAISDATPGVSIAVRSAAERIVRASRDGVSETMVSLPARLATTFHGIFPGLTSDVNAMLNRALPGPGGIGQERRLGKESESALAPSLLTALNERAAAEHNEVRSH
jgi:NAD(P)-dependent dehydrogenase (short-subunit alcohol dehydrogenase family)